MEIGGAFSTWVVFHIVAVATASAVIDIIIAGVVVAHDWNIISF